MNRSELLSAYPDVFLLAECSPAFLAAYLADRGWIAPGDSVTAVEPAGEGNMNTTVRVTTGGGSLVLKQSVPWVAKYPDIPAPHDRVIREARFYQMVYPYPEVAGRMPDLLGLDIVQRLACFSDLGRAGDLTALYARDHAVSDDAVQAVAAWLSALHALEFGPEEQQALPNRDMRALNHEHVFVFPLRPDNGLDLDGIQPGLAALAAETQADGRFRDSADELGRIYLDAGPTLLHGDPFPGSFLATPEGLRAIDPEFAFFGRAEFDAGVFAAHLVLAHRGEDAVRAWFRAYRAPAGFDESLARAFAGIEVMRRLIGVAQLPLQAGIDDRRSWMDWARAQLR